MVTAEKGFTIEFHFWEDSIAYFAICWYSFGIY